ncbi:MAG: hypothetical protein ABL940_05685 [Bacteroidia bacterium]
MTKILTYCFDKWWRPVLVFGLTALIMVLCELTNKPNFQDYSFLLFALGFLGLIISTVYQFIKKRWRFAILTITIVAISLVAFFLYSIALFWKDQSMPDRYADNLKIPKNIKLCEPLEETQPTDIADIDFYIYNSHQPGLYQYYFWAKRLDKGKIYLKAFEVTKNAPLSVDRLKESSTISIYNPTDSLVMFQMDKGNSQYGRPFTIYEGDWGKPYAARFELWFIPDSEDKERKLIEKNYKIEGWQR